MSCGINFANRCNEQSSGHVHPNVPDGNYYVSEIEVNNGDITNITTHRNADGNIYIGAGAVATGPNYNAISIGTNATCSNADSSISIGPNSSNDTNSDGSLALGHAVQNSASETISIGNTINNSGTASIKIGVDDAGDNTADYSISIGNVGNITKSQHSVNVGLCEMESDLIGQNIAIGMASALYGDTNCLIGVDNLIGTSMNKLSGVHTMGFSNTSTANNTTSMGTGLRTGGLRGTNFGTSNHCYGQDSTTIGYNNIVGTSSVARDNVVAIGANITETSTANRLILGGANQFDDVYINNLASEDTLPGISAAVGSVHYNSGTKEVTYSTVNSGVLTKAGSFTISGTGSQTVMVGFLPRQIRVYLDNGLSNGGSQGMTGEWTYDATSPVQFAQSHYVAGATNVRGFNTSNVIALSTNGTTYSEVARIDINPGMSVTTFDVTCTTYTTTRDYYYVAYG